VQEFILNEIKDVESANKFMATYIKKFNRRFSVVPKGEPVFRKPGKGINIDHILCRKIPRKLDGGSAFSYMGKYYQLLSGGPRYDPGDEELAPGLFNSTIAWETDNY